MANNNEMGVLVSRADDVELYRDAYDEAQRIIRISEEVRISLERVGPKDERMSVAAVPASTADSAPAPAKGYDKLTMAKLAAKLGMPTKELFARLTEVGLLQLKEGRHYVTPAGKGAGGEWKPGAGGGYLLWSAGMTLDGPSRR
jgi:hypothetical protein